jgi:choline dehydrogenase
MSTAITSLEPIRDRPNLIRGNSLVDRVLFDGGQVAGVELAHADQREIVTAHRVTISAGAIGTPAILLRSGLGPTDELTALGIESVADLPGVGANLIDHPQIGFSLTAHAGPSDGSLPCFQVLPQWTAPGSEDRNDMQSMPLHLPEQPAIRLTTAVMCPRSSGTVRLVERSPHTAPDIRLNLASDPDDIRRLGDGLRQLTDIAVASDVAALHDGIAHLDDGTQIHARALRAHFDDTATANTYVAESASHYVHPAGTAKTGSKDNSTAVADQPCRVRGIRGLLVADASVMPSIPRVNTHLTCVAIRQRVGTWILNEDAHD